MSNISSVFRAVVVLSIFYLESYLISLFLCQSKNLTAGFECSVCHETENTTAHFTLLLRASSLLSSDWALALMAEDTSGCGISPSPVVLSAPLPHLLVAVIPRWIMPAAHECSGCKMFKCWMLNLSSDVEKHLIVICKSAEYNKLPLPYYNVQVPLE